MDTYPDEYYETCDSCSCCTAGRCHSREGNECGDICPCTND